jgi:hemerythrin-like domain-containing protein
MAQAPNLLNDDGSASMATALMMSHHAFRRDLVRFSRALPTLAAAGDVARVAAVHAEWQWFHNALHGHHHSEDSGIFPGLAKEHDSVRSTIEKLAADHRLIDPILERGDRAFADLANGTSEAIVVISELQALLNPHLAIEEAEIVPFLRDAKEFPTPPDDFVEMYAQGFSWAMHGIADSVLEKVMVMLPEPVRTRLPAARAAFAVRCEQAWGVLRPGCSTTPIPQN